MTRREELEVRREFAARMRRLMEARGLTVAGLARRAKLDRPTVEAILAARHPIWIDEVFLLAGALGVEPAELVSQGPREEGEGNA
jgi:transcriptional regulator with XRE-family HTH domain